jgi:DNA-binding CsgD family transcriptional regulator
MSHDSSWPQEARSALDVVQQVDRVYGPQLPHLRRAGLVLARYGDPRPFLDAKKALTLALAALQALPSPEACAPITSMKASISLWRKVAVARQAYETQLTCHPHAAEFLWLLEEAIVGHRWARRALRRVGLVCRGGAVRFLRRLPAAPAAALEPYCAYRRYALIVQAGLCAGCAAYLAGEGVPAIVQRATLAMRQMWFDSLPLQPAWLMAVPIPEVQAVGALACAGWIRPQIRLYPSVRAALGIAGDPRTVLLERLAGDVFEAFHAGGNTPDAWVKHVRRVVDQTRRMQPKRSLTRAPEAGLESRHTRRKPTQPAPSMLEEWYAKQEARQRLEALIPQAGLSPREAEVLLLQRAGLTHAQIASTLGKAKGSVKQWTFRVHKKLRNAAGL